MLFSCEGQALPFGSDSDFFVHSIGADQNSNPFVLLLLMWEIGLSLAPLLFLYSRHNAHNSHSEFSDSFHLFSPFYSSLSLDNNRFWVVHFIFFPVILLTNLHLSHLDQILLLNFHSVLILICLEEEVEELQL